MKFKHENIVQKVIRYFVFVVAITTLLSCSNVGKENRRRTMQLKLGMPRAEVVNIMGMPHHNEGSQAEGKEREILYYPTGSLSPESSFTPLVFEDGKLICWGKVSCNKEVPSGNL